MNQIVFPEATAKAIEQAARQIAAVRLWLDSSVCEAVAAYAKALDPFKPAIESSIKLMQSQAFQAAMAFVVHNAAIPKLAMQPESVHRLLKSLELPSKDEAAELTASLDDPGTIDEANSIVAEWSQQSNLEEPPAQGRHNWRVYRIAMVVIGSLALTCINFPVEKTLEQLFPVPDPQQSQLARQLESQGKMLEEVREGQARLERQVANLQNRLPVDGNRECLATPNSGEEQSLEARPRRKRPK